jgi:hypothetical protein
LLAAKSKNKNFLWKSNIKLPAYVDFIERMAPHIVINSNLGTIRQLDLYGIPLYMTKIFCKVKENFLRKYVKHFLAAVLLALPHIFQDW